MTVCKTCGERYHSCPACGLIYDWEWDYCSENCWRNSPEYSRVARIIELFAFTLEPYQRFMLLDILENVSSDYDNIFIEALKPRGE